MYEIPSLDRKRGFIFFYIFFAMSSVVYSAITLDDPTSLRVGDLRTVLVPQLFTGLEISCANNMKLWLKVPFKDTPTGLACFFALATAFATEKKVLALSTVVGSEAMTAQFHQVLSQYLAAS
jgi:hypothetical protein